MKKKNKDVEIITVPIEEYAWLRKTSKMQQVTKIMTHIEIMIHKAIMNGEHTEVCPYAEILHAVNAQHEDFHQFANMRCPSEDCEECKIEKELLKTQQKLREGKVTFVSGSESRQ